MKKTLLLATLTMASSAFAYEAQVTKGAMNPDVDALLAKARVETGVDFAKENIALIEDRDLATSHYKYYVQTSQFIPVAQTAIRIWSDKQTGELILAEINLDEKSTKDEASLAAKYRKAKFSPGALKSNVLKMAINKIATEQVSSHATDNRVLGIKSRDQWQNGDLVRVVEVRGRRGVHRVVVSLLQNRVLEKTYSEFPQSELISLKANIFPMYEEVEGTGEKLNYEVKELKYIKTEIPDAGENPLGDIATTQFPEQRYNPVLAETEIGRQYDIWSEATIRRKVESIVAGYPLKSNDLGTGLLLQGKYATIQIHPAAKDAFQGINFDLKQGPNHMLAWKATDDGYVAQARAGLLGHTIHSDDELLNRIPFRLPKHDAVQYMNQGFDEQQVYYSVTTLMERLSTMGFTDPVLSARPFHAFLYDPDIGMKDNAYYTDDTINFTTYSPGNPNLARDNPTIWHELGHGVMERLMGAFLVFEETKSSYGGLSEGMADFVAKIIVEDQTNSEDFPGKYNFRIENNTGFYLTNELHDGGEAYGGVMKDMLIDAIKAKGRDGLRAFADLTMETMRLTRNHPNLTPRSWFEHMVYADSLGSSFRAAGDYKAIINEALAARNFAFSSSFRPAAMDVKYGDMVLTSTSNASREKPIKACDASGTASYELKVKLTAGDSNFITFPATVKVEYRAGALQGALKWAGEENNPQVYTVNSADELLSIPLSVNTKECD
ncbi:MAG: hypothetical protein ACJ76H_00535, partial [Bacteriovoracaceae bacterium]